MAPNARDERIDTNDPQRHLVYAAEDSVLDDIGRRLRRWTDVEAFVEAILADPAYLDLFPDAPLDVVLDRRSRSARASVALPDRATILIRDGSWNALTVLHELSHLVSPDREPHGADFLLYSLLDVIVDNYFVIVEDLGKRIETMEERVVKRPREKDLLDMQALRRQLVGISRQVTPTRELAGRMNIIPSKLIDKNTRRYINDLQDHTVYISESIAMFRDQLTNLENTYHAGLNMRMGQVMKLLTVISTIFIPLTFIVGVYGMNFQNMPELHWRYGYYAVMGAMLLISLVMLVLFRRKGWL